MNDGKERLCSGCNLIIASFDREAFSINEQGRIWVHGKTCETRYLNRSYMRYLASLHEQARKVVVN